jgi:hypothetical protein
METEEQTKKERTKQGKSNPKAIQREKKTIDMNGKRRDVHQHNQKKGEREKESKQSKEKKQKRTSDEQMPLSHR